jgi:hypothetical protein
VCTQDGVIETEELVSFIESVISTENRLKQLKLIAGLLIVFMGVFMAATFGLTYVVADLHKDTISMVWYPILCHIAVHLPCY